MKPKKEERILLMHKWTVTRRSLMAALLVSCPGTRRRSDCRQAGHRSFVGGWKDRLHDRATYHHEPEPQSVRAVGRAVFACLSAESRRQNGPRRADAAIGL